MSKLYPKKLSIIIVSWNVRDLLAKCLQSIIDNVIDIDYEIIVVDNASTDGTTLYIKNNFPNIKLLANQLNVGFSKANNQGVSEAIGEYLLFLNPDTEFIDRQSLVSAIDYFNSHRICLMGWRVLNSDLSTQVSVRKFPTLYSQIVTLAKINNLFPSANKKYFCLDFDYDKTQEVDTIIGACMLTTKSYFDIVGGFDEDYYIWFEEVDMCYRYKQKSLPVLYFSEARIIHHGGQSFKQLLSLPKQKIFNKSLLIYWQKNKPAWQALVLRIFIPINLFLTGLQQIFNIKKNGY